MKYIFDQQHKNYDIGEIFDAIGRTSLSFSYVFCNDILGEYPSCKLEKNIYELEVIMYNQKICNFLHDVKKNDECTKIMTKHYDNGDEKKVLIIKRDENYIVIIYELRTTMGKEELLFVYRCNDLNDFKNTIM